MAAQLCYQQATARQQGFDERQVFSADASFDWGTLLQAGASMSLFAENACWSCACPRASLVTKVLQR